MKIYIEIKEPRNLYDTYGKSIKGPVKSLTPFESLDGAIKWLKFIDQRARERDEKKDL